MEKKLIEAKLMESELVKMKEAQQVEEQVREEPLVLEGIHQLSQMTQCQIRISYVSNQGKTLF